MKTQSTTYSIRYNHRSSQTATSMTGARRLVRSQMRGTHRRRFIECADGIYCYECADDANRDRDDGSRAFAVITTNEQD